MQAKFNTLPLGERIALRRICDGGAIKSQDLKASLRADFSDPDLAVAELIQNGFIQESGNGVLQPRHKWISAFFRDKPISI
jgi:hypothetical protein